MEVYDTEVLPVPLSQLEEHRKEEELEEEAERA